VPRTEESNGAPSLSLPERGSGQPAEPPSDEFITRNSGNAEFVKVGWWPGDVAGIAKALILDL
jgi:hypothetical protein